MERSYSTDLSDKEWGCLQIHAPAPNKRGRPKTHSTREILNAIFYVSKSGCPWRLLPRDLERPGRLFTGGSADGASTGPSSGSTPSYASGYGHGRVGPAPERRHRRLLGEAKTTGVGGEERGYDGGKKVRGRKRHHLLVDTEEGLVLKAKVHSAKVPNQDGLRLLLLESARTGLSRLKHLWLEAG